VKEHFISAVRARWLFLLNCGFHRKAAIRSTEETPNCLPPNRRLRLSDAEIVSGVIDHELPDLAVAELGKTFAKLTGKLARGSQVGSNGIESSREIT
jgi:hypothetical protein